MTTDDLKAWQARMGFTQRAAAAALGVSLPTYQSWLRGRSWQGDRPVEIDQRTALACAALEAGIGKAGAAEQRS